MSRPADVVRPDDSDGFGRLAEALPDLTCDVPNAKALLDEFLAQAKAEAAAQAKAQPQAAAQMDLRLLCGSAQPRLPGRAR